MKAKNGESSLILHVTNGAYGIDDYLDTPHLLPLLDLHLGLAHPQWLSHEALAITMTMRIVIIIMVPLLTAPLPIPPPLFLVGILAIPEVMDTLDTRNPERRVDLPHLLLKKTKTLIMSILILLL